MAQIHNQQELPPVELSSALMTEPATFRRIYTEGIFRYDGELRLLGRTVNQTIGYYLFTPLVLGDGRIIYVNRGWVESSVPDHEISRPLGKIRVDGVLRDKMSRNLFTPANHYESREIFAFDPQEIEQANVIPYYIDATYIHQQKECPKLMKQEIQLRNHHRLYALTWFSLAGGLAIVCFLFIRSKQRDEKL
jgi:surfeit locus 1 family protein